MRMLPVDHDAVSVIPRFLQRPDEMRVPICGCVRRLNERKVDRELVYNDGLTAKQWALNSAVECHPHRVEVVGSNPTAPTIFSITYRTHIPCSHTVQRKPCNLATRNRHFIGDHIPVSIHRCANVSMPHQLLLHGYRCSNRVKPCPVAVPHRVSAESSDASLCARLLVHAPNL